jgi:hypothetical protein
METKEQRKASERRAVNLRMAFLLGAGVRCVSFRSLNLCLPLDEHPSIRIRRPPSIHHDDERRTRTRTRTSRRPSRRRRTRRARRRPSQHTPSRRCRRRCCRCRCRRRLLWFPPRLVLLRPCLCLSRRCYQPPTWLRRWCRCEQQQPTAGSPSSARQTLSLHTSKNVSVQGLWRLSHGFLPQRASC